MIREQKELLLKDLYARLLYKPHCCVFKLNGDIKENDDVLYGVIGDNVMTLKSDKDECLMYYQIKPYLRPLSSMTDEEYLTIYDMCWPKDLEFKATCGFYWGNFKTKKCIPDFMYNPNQIDYLTFHHFDYRGLIPIGLALEATEGMYNIK